MTDKDKLNRIETLDFLRKRIGGCFGSEDGVFAGHPADEERAKELLKLGASHDVSLAELQDISLGYLYRKNYLGKHVSEQMEKVTKYFSKKLK